MNKTIERIVEKENRAYTMNSMLETINDLIESGHAVVPKGIAYNIKELTTNFPPFTDYQGRIEQGKRMEKIIKLILENKEVELPLFIIEKIESIVA